MTLESVNGLASYLYVALDRRRAGAFHDAALEATSERHAVRLTAPALQPCDVDAELSRRTVAGVVFEMAAGLPTDADLRLMARALASGRRVWLFWPGEQAVECIDGERLTSLRQHARGARWLKRVCVPIDTALTRWDRVPTALRWVYRGEFPVRRSDIEIELSRAVLRAQPLPLDDLGRPGMYLRCDYWREPAGDARMQDVVGSLAKTAGQVVVLNATHEPLLDATEARQVVMERPPRDADEDAIVLAPTHYRRIVRTACQTAAPGFLYERLTAGQSAGAAVSQSLAIPYIVEYPGATALRCEAVGDRTPFYPELYARAEELALRQATVVVVASDAERTDLVARGIDAAKVVVAPNGCDVGPALSSALASLRRRATDAASLETGDAYKDQVQNQWNQNPVGAQHARESQPHTLEWFREVERHRYGAYAPWMPEVMEFSRHGAEDVLEIGGGIGTDLAQFAANGARVTDIDLAAGHLALAQENFRLRGLRGTFVHHDAESLPFADGSFDLVYSNGVLHHTPNTKTVVDEIHRVLRPGGRAIVMLYAEQSLHYWRQLVWALGIKMGQLDRQSMGEIMSRTVERSANDAKPLVKVYTRRRAAALFDRFDDVEIVQRQLGSAELPRWLRPARGMLERRFGWNLIVKAKKRR